MGMVVRPTLKHDDSIFTESLRMELQSLELQLRKPRRKKLLRAAQLVMEGLRLLSRASDHADAEYALEAALENATEDLGADTTVEDKIVATKVAIAAAVCLHAEVLSHPRDAASLAEDHLRRLFTSSSLVVVIDTEFDAPGGLQAIYRLDDGERRRILTEVAALASFTWCWFDRYSLELPSFRVGSAGLDPVRDLIRFERRQTLEGHTAFVNAVALGGGRLYSASRDQTLRVWNVETLTYVASLTGHNSWVRALAFWNGRLYAGSDDNDIHVWDVTTMECIGLLQGHAGAVIALACAAGRLLSGSSDGTIGVWDVESMQRIGTLEGDGEMVRALAARDGWLYSGSDGRAIKVWDTSSLSCVGSLDGAWVRALALDGNRLYSGSDDRSIKVWDVHALQSVGVLQGHTGAVSALVFMRGRLYSGSEDMTLRVWDIEAMRCVNVLADHGDWVRALVSQGGQIFSGCDDGTLQVWGGSTSQMAERLDGVAGLIR